MEPPMSSLDRRRFLSATLAAGAAPGLLIAQPPQAKPKETKQPPAPNRFTPIEHPERGPDTLFLTWRSDPTTTCVVQWIGRSGGGAQPQVSYSPLGAEHW